MGRRFNRKRKPKHTTKVKYIGVCKYYADYMEGRITYIPWQLHSVRIGGFMELLIRVRVSKKYHSIKLILPKCSE